MMAEKNADKPAALTALTQLQATVSIPDGHAQGYCTRHIPNGHEYQFSFL